MFTTEEIEQMKKGLADRRYIAFCLRTVHIVDIDKFNEMTQFVDKLTPEQLVDIDKFGSLWRAIVRVPQ
jgi:hypothetical protein